MSGQRPDAWLDAPWGADEFYAMYRHRITNPKDPQSRNYTTQWQTIVREEMRAEGRNPDAGFGPSGETLA